ncbi:alpha galactosidase A [Kribbella sp. VKM Ac-2569]|uniref:glycoside hydrolase family 27 protein n=1 Tax=Kribbella sp. VKM Ac-2569 TaxID=2512220 RepID=UPI0010F25D68|nr:glycoside hydrolase family 27 protein [Kribbella sp. VKM Ac-2569]RZT28656.1 alpha galactosidase A [Kribbella sp. VKM Ac-2569]
MVSAATPPMGWNSWDCFGTTVTEAEVLANAQVMHDQLLPFGWDTVVVDIAWYDPTARSHGYNENAPVVLDDYGRQLPAPLRFPSAASGAGFGPLAAKVHELGLKFGLHIMRGIPRRAVELDLPVYGTQWTAREVADPDHVCAWNPDNLGLNHDHPGAQAYYDAQVAQFAEWGVDFVKADDMLAPYHDREIAAYAQAIARSGRDIVLSLSPGTRLSTHHVEHLRANAQLWRISDDLWDRWEDVHAQFARLARWAPFQQTGGWADADMLPLGHIGIRAERGDDRDSRLTVDEQKTLLTLWVMARSPLMMGGDLPTTAPETLALLANPALAEVLRSSYDGREIIREPVDDGELIVWTAQGEDWSYAALFWTGATSREVPLPAELPTPAQDLWAGTPTTERVHIVPAHGVCWLKVSSAL